MNLYRSQTIAQYKIGVWLEEQGVKREDIETVELLCADRVKVTNPAGQYIEICWCGEQAKIV